jgi:hypothetical protein
VNSAEKPWMLVLLDRWLADLADALPTYPAAITLAGAADHVAWLNRRSKRATV